MKIGGKTYDKPKMEELYLPRADGAIKLLFVAVANDEDFLKLCPRPMPPRVFKKSLNATIDDVEDKNYIKKIDEWSDMKTDWLFLQSIKPSEVEWSSVDLSDAGTFKNWKQDLIDAGFSIGERNAIWSAFSRANLMSDAMLKEARESFLLGQEAAALAKLSSPSSEANGTQSGNAASPGESVPQA